MRKQPFKDFISGSGAKTGGPSAPLRTISSEPTTRRQSFGFSNKKSDKKSFFSKINTKVVVFVFVIFFILFLWMSSAFSSVVVKITTISEDIALDDTFVAVSSKDAVEDAVSFKTMKLEESESVAIIASGTKRVSQKASGEIIIYNNFSTSPQTLIANTRFESPDGKIFKIDRRVVVPGRTTVLGKSVPGSLTVTVYAAEAGAEYNIKATDFTLPGLKGGARYTSVYARGKGDMSGGLVGDLKIVSPDDVSIAKKKLEDSISKKLRQNITEQVPPDYIAYDDASFFTFEDNTKDIGSEWEGDKVYLKMKGTAETFIFNRNELASIITKSKLESLNNYDVHSNDLDSLSFKILAKDSISPSTTKMFSLRLTGGVKIIWNIDTEGFKQDLLGVKKESYQEIFKKYPTIEKAETVFKPSWSRSFPENVDRINIELVED